MITYVMFITVKFFLFRLDLIMSNTAQQFTTRLPKCFFIDSKESFKFEKDSFDFDTFKFNATDYHCKFVIDFWNSSNQNDYQIYFIPSTIYSIIRG